MRKRIYEVIEAAKENDKLSYAYDIIMMAAIVAGLIPLMTKQDVPVFSIIDKIVAGIFIIDYILRLITADFKLKKGALSFIIYPFTPLAILDLICILPSISFISNKLGVIRVFRLFRTLRVFRVFKAVRYSKSIKLIKGAFVKQKRPLLTVGVIALIYIFVSALVIYNVEPDSFNTFFDALYWATISLTAIGYGDIYPVTTTGRLVTMLSSIFGIAVIALPSGIITAGFMDELRHINEDIE